MQNYFHRQNFRKKKAGMTDKLILWNNQLRTAGIVIKVNSRDITIQGALI